MLFKYSFVIKSIFFYKNKIKKRLKLVFSLDLVFFQAKENDRVGTHRF
jgi:hypothetical protein